MISILVSLNMSYLPWLKVLLTSLHLNNPNTAFHIYLLHREIPDKVLQGLADKAAKIGFRLTPIRVDEGLLSDAPVSKRYPQEMYYRLLAGFLLPDNLDRILYLDPDILVLNPIGDLWNIDMGDKLFAAAAHTHNTELANNINRIRLGTQNNYYNSGVLLINLEQCRKRIVPCQLFNFVKEHTEELLLPDQDILNCLYGGDILEIDDTVWNYDARNFRTYLLHSHGLCTMDWVIQNTVFLHFCGKQKPWKPQYSKRFAVLYKHYMQLTARLLPDNETPPT